MNRDRGPSPQEGLDLVFCSDINYAPHMATALASMCLNSPKEIRRCFVVSYDLTQEHVDAINQHLTPSTSKVLELVSADEESVSDFHVSKHLSSAAYLRFFLPTLLPEDVGPVLYLDGDTITRRSVSELATLAEAMRREPGDSPLAWCRQEGDGEHLRRFGHPGDRYFNSGVMLINLARWRSEEVSENLVLAARQLGEQAMWWDQDALNLVLGKDWGNLAGKFNYQGIGESEEVVIAHFTGTTKPWEFGCRHPLAAEYQHYRELTPFVPFTKTGLKKYLLKPISPRGWRRRYKAVRRIMRGARRRAERLLIPRKNLAS